MPIYDLGSIDGQPHKRSFVLVAKVGVIGKAGNGTSKKVNGTAYWFHVVVPPNLPREGVIIECPLIDLFHDARDVILTSRILLVRYESRTKNDNIQ